MTRIKVPRLIHKESFLIQLGFMPIPPNVVAECSSVGQKKKMNSKDEIKIPYNPYDEITTEMLYKNIITIIGNDIGVSPYEVYEQLDKEGKLPKSVRVKDKYLPFNTFIRYFYNAHKLSGIKVPSKIEKAYRLVIKGFSDEYIVNTAKVHASTAKRIKTLLGYPGYEGKIYDKDFIRAVTNAQRRFGR